jgi:CRISPR/Cas system CSM-associated protein Csm3 (group 7 of RAMP superfamily)
LSGTGLAGALRARALKIANTMDARGQAQELIDGMFGKEMQTGVQPEASRVIVTETVVQNARTDLVQYRVSIDRFTGGARETALFSEQPIFANDDTQVTLRLELLSPQDHEVGLVLLLLKDLWTGDLPLGGESSVGRGRLRGKEARIGLDTLEWSIRSVNGDTLEVEGDKQSLEGFVTAFVREVGK